MRIQFKFVLTVDVSLVRRRRLKKPRQPAPASHLVAAKVFVVQTLKPLTQLFAGHAIRDVGN